MARVGDHQHQVLVAWLDNYDRRAIALARIAAEVRRGWVKRPSRVKDDDFTVRFHTKAEVEAKLKGKAVEAASVGGMRPIRHTITRAQAEAFARMSGEEAAAARRALAESRQADRAAMALPLERGEDGNGRFTGERLDGRDR